MTRAANSGHGLVLGLHPTPRGVGWILFEGPLSPIDWAIVRSNVNAKCVERIERLFDRFTPAVLVLEAFESPHAERADRIQRLCRSFMHLADNRGFEVRIYSVPAVRLCFANMGAKTRYEIAQAVATHIPALRHRLPARPRSHDRQDTRMALFCAAALALTHFALGGAP